MADINSSLPVRTEANGDIVTKLVDYTTNTQGLAISSNGEASVKVKNGTSDPAGVAVIVSGAAIDPRDIRALVSSDVVTVNQGLAAAATGAWPVNIQDASGNAFTAGNPLPVVLSDVVTGAVEVLDYDSQAVTTSTPLDHTYTITSGKDLYLQKIVVSSSGKMKIEIKIGTIGSPPTVIVLFNSTANPNVEYKFSTPQILADTSEVTITKTNLDKATDSIYSTIEGYEL